MQKIRYGLIALSMMLLSVNFASAQVSIGIGFPNVSIGINLPLFPELVPVPGYPVYYAPRVDANYFFYDGMYWVYQNDNWYASSWYNGPWSFVEPQVVPLFILRIPVRYYRQPPVYFRGWQSNAPPRWGQHWGSGWEQRRRGWDRWNRSSAPARAPLPAYQRQYSGDRYPRIEQQQTLRSQSYRYQPRDKVVRQHLQQQDKQRAVAPAQRGRQEAPPVRNQRQQEPQRSTPPQQGAPAGPHTQPPQRGGEHVQSRTPPKQPGAPQQQQRAPKQQPAAPQQQPRAPQREQQQQRAPKQQPAAPQQQPRAPQREQQQQRAPKQQPAAPQQQPRVPQREQQAPSAQGQEHKEQDRGAQQEPNRGRGSEQNKDEERGRGRNN